MSNLKRIRQSLGMSQAKLAEISGVNVRMIQYYEQGVKDINKAQAITVYSLSYALDVHVYDILDMERLKQTLESVYTKRTRYSINKSKKEAEE